VAVATVSGLMFAASARRGNSGVADPATPQYPVLLLSEDQVAQLLRRQAMRTIDTRFAAPRVAFSAYLRLMRRARIVMALLLLISAGAGAWLWAPLPVLAAFPWTTEEAPPALATGASFSLTVGSSRSAQDAAAMARRLAAAGRPSYLRTQVATHHVMVGPFVSLDEAEGEQRRLAGAGVSGTRIFVDDSLRKASNAPAAIAAGNPAMVLVGAGKQVSLALEFEHEPKQVTTKRGADGTVVVEMGPMASAIETQEWSAPAGVSLLRQVKVEEIVGAPEARHARATLLMPRSTMAHARVEGRRVYIDFMVAPRKPRRPTPDAIRSPARQPLAEPVAASQAAAMAGAPVTPAVETPRAASVDSLRPLLTRVERMVPFLQSATRTSSPDVLRALASNVDELDAALRQVPATPEIADAHGALSAAMASARRAVDAGFGGDHVAEAHQAGLLVEAAKTALPVMPAR
jgi:cell division protein FtsN